MNLDNIVNKTWNHLSNFRHKLASNTKRAVYVGLIALALTAGTKIVKAIDHDSLQYKLNNNITFVYEEQNHRGIEGSNNMPTDPLLQDQWYLYNINAPEAWEITNGGDPNIVIAVLDNGVDYNHPDLFDNIWANPKIVQDTNKDGVINIHDVDLNQNRSIEGEELNYYGSDKAVIGWDFYDNDNSPGPLLGDHPKNAHGTGVAGLIAAKGNNDIGIAGIAYNCKIILIRISKKDDFVTDADVATSIRWAAERADILNLSWGNLFETPIIHSAIKDVTKEGGIGSNGKGCIVLASSGNWKTGGPILFPAKYPEVIAVGATNHNNEVWGYNSQGFALELMAPGGDINGYGTIWTTDITGEAGYNNSNPNISQNYTNKIGGTSEACPIVSGVAALVLSRNPNLTGLQVRRILSRSAQDLGDKGWDKYSGNGLINAYEAVSMALNPPLPRLFVDASAKDNPLIEDGSIEYPFNNIQKAINNAVQGDNVIVMPGIYAGKGNRDIEFHRKIITVNSKEGPENCIIDCENLGRGFFFHEWEEASSILSGFTITNGNANYGAGIKCSGNSSPTINNCIFTNNIAQKRGGGMYNFNSPTLTNCTFSKNSAGDYGGGIFNTINSNPKITNCIFWYNLPNEIQLEEESNPKITYSNIQGGWPGIGNINEDPLFADPNNGDYHLKSQAGRWDTNIYEWVHDNVTSPCIDAGDPNSPLENELLHIPDDPNNPNVTNLRRNMGAYGGTPEASFAPYEPNLQ